MDNDLQRPATDDQLSLLDNTQPQGSNSSNSTLRTASDWLKSCEQSFDAARTSTQATVASVLAVRDDSSANLAHVQSQSRGLQRAPIVSSNVPSGTALEADKTHIGSSTSLAHSSSLLAHANDLGSVTGTSADTEVFASFAGAAPQPINRLNASNTHTVGEQLFQHHALGELAASAVEAAIVTGLSETLYTNSLDGSDSDLGVGQNTSGAVLASDVSLSLVAATLHDQSGAGADSVSATAAAASNTTKSLCTVKAANAKSKVATSNSDLAASEAVVASIASSLSSPSHGLAPQASALSLASASTSSDARVSPALGSAAAAASSAVPLAGASVSKTQMLSASTNGVVQASPDLREGNRLIRKAVIVSKVYHRPVGGAIVEIARLLNSLGVDAYTDQSTAVGFNLDEVPILSRRGMKDTDLIIVVGGDGSLLGASRSLVDLQVPVLGINRGHLGLLTDISPNNLEDALSKVVAGKYTTENRMMIDVRVLRRDEEGSEELIGQSLALNETVIHSGILAHMIVCRVSINGRYMYTLRSDGIIVGTPTGSTAYSLSAGGPIIEPHLDVLCLVPMFPQSLNCSPIILPGKSQVEVEFEIKDSMPEWVNVNCDGQVTIRADTKCLVSIRQHPNQLQLIHPAGYDYYSVLRQKLGWGQSLVN